VPKSWNKYDALSLSLSSSSGGHSDPKTDLVQIQKTQGFIGSQGYINKLLRIMKHIQLFEGWQQTEMDFKMTPEKFEQEVDNAIATMSPVDAVRHIRNILKDNRHLQHDLSAIKSLKKAAEYVDTSLSQEERDALHQDSDPEGYAIKKERREKKQAAVDSISSVLDRLLAGDISKEEAVADLSK